MIALAGALAVDPSGLRRRRCWWPSHCPRPGTGRPGVLLLFLGLLAVLGAFFADGVLAVLDRAGMADPALRDRLDGLGYGFLIPVFFIASGTPGLLGAGRPPGALVLMPLLLLALLAARARRRRCCTATSLRPRGPESGCGPWRRPCELPRKSPRGSRTSQP